ncbi:MAG: gp436 family protein [Azonexus sp.]
MYATQADLENRFGAEELAQRSDRINGSVIDAAVVARALADAEAEIDAYLAARYQLPLVSTPPILVRLACDIAIYRLCDTPPDEVRKRYEDAVRDLKRAADGVLVIDGAAVLDKSPSGIGVSFKSPGRVFNADELAGY